MTIGGLGYGYGAGYYNPYETMVRNQGVSNQIDFAAATKKVVSVPTTCFLLLKT